MRRFVWGGSLNYCDLVDLQSGQHSEKRKTKKNKKKIMEIV